MVAGHLARAALRVALLEEHPQVGLPNHCSGLISPRTLAVAGLRDERLVERRYRQARVWGPDGRTLWLRSPRVQAVTVDRTRFDRKLAERAVAAGVDLRLGTQATAMERVPGGVRVFAHGPDGPLELEAPLLIGADGANSRVAHWLARRPRGEVVPVIKADLTFRPDGPDDIGIFVGRDVAPGWFGWAIPLGDGRVRVGLGASHGLRAYYTAFLDRLRAQFGDFTLDLELAASLPLGPVRDFVADNIMLVGAAARQTKPTTGGGVYFGLRAAELAAATALQALRLGDCSSGFLAGYERAWQLGPGWELRVNRWLRWFYRHLSDAGLARLMWAGNTPWAQHLIGRLGDVDFPSWLFVSSAETACREQTQVETTDYDCLARREVR